MLKSHRFWIAGVLVCFVFTLCFPLFTQRGPLAQEVVATLPDFLCYRTLDTVLADAATQNFHENKHNPRLAFFLITLQRVSKLDSRC